jgi:hypothetical protein
MSKRGSGKNETFWMWTGETEYEGEVLSVKGTGVTARIRRVDRKTPMTGPVGNTVPLDLVERQRHLARRIGFAQSPAILAGTLTEFRVVAIQPSRDPHFEFVLSGMFWPVADIHLEKLSKLDSNKAFEYLQKNSSRAFAPSQIKTG